MWGSEYSTCCSLVKSKGIYYHLAEFDDGIIAIKEGEQTGKLYYCHYSGWTDELSSDFGKELIEKIKNTTPHTDYSAYPLG